MKNILSTTSYFVVFMTIGLLLLLGFSFTSVQTAHACSLPEGYERPTPTEILSDNGVIFLAEIIESGREVPGKVLYANFGEPTTIMHGLAGHSCSLRFDPYTQGEFIVTVTPRTEMYYVEPAEADKQFSWSFETLEEAKAKFDEIINSVPVVITVTEGTSSPNTPLETENVEEEAVIVYEEEITSETQTETTNEGSEETLNQEPSTSPLVETNTEPVNLWQRFVRWLQNLFR